MQEQNFFTCFEEAVTEYGAQVNTYNIRDNMLNLYGSETGSNLTQQKISSNNPHLLAQKMRSSMRKSGKDYGNEFNEVVHRLEKGENPNLIERSLRKRSGEDKHMCPDGHVH